MAPSTLYRLERSTIIIIILDIPTTTTFLCVKCTAVIDQRMPLLGCPSVVIVVVNELKVKYLE